MFTGFPEATIRFFLDLRYHNDKAYYKAHEDAFIRDVKTPFYAFIDELAPFVQSVSPDIDVRPYRCLARIYRDTRFTKDKAPFRDHLWLSFRRAGESRENSVMYWFELGPDSVNWGLGFWGENRPAMDALRRRITEKPKQILSSLKECGLPNDDGLVISGNTFKRMIIPDSVPERLRSLYMAKSFYVERINARVADAYQPSIVDMVKNDILRLKPMYILLRELADEGMAKREG